MRDGTDGSHGNPGNDDSATCTFQKPIEGSNPSLSATKLLISQHLLVNCRMFKHLLTFAGT